MSEASPINAISFDVEEYFHALNFRALLGDSPQTNCETRVERGTRAILDILSATSTRATFFILGRVAESAPSLVREIASRGHEIASHGISHKTVPELGPEGFRSEAVESRKLLEDLTGCSVKGFRASTFSITRNTLWALEILAESGYTYDSSIFPVYHDRYGIADFPRQPVRVRTDTGASLIEFPPLTLALPGYNLPCGGGGYFRLFPPVVFRWALRRMNRAAFPGVLYLHPWEFDPGQPRHHLGGFKTFRHYHNMEKTAQRLDRLLRIFPFGPIKSLTGDPERWVAYPVQCQSSV